MRVLLVDDEADLASALAERLDMRGIEADWVDSGQEALERVAQSRYDLAVLDLRMPKIGGLELKARMQALYGGDLNALGADVTGIAFSVCR